MALKTVNRPIVVESYIPGLDNTAVSRSSSPEESDRFGSWRNSGSYFPLFASLCFLFRIVQQCCLSIFLSWFFVDHDGLVCCYMCSRGRHFLCAFKYGPVRICNFALIGGSEKLF